MATRKNRAPLPSRYTSRARGARRDYIQGVLDGTIAEPKQGTPEAKSLARLASLARWGQAPAIYEDRWSKYWYKESEEPPDEDPDGVDYESDM